MGKQWFQQVIDFGDGLFDGVEDEDDFEDDDEVNHSSEPSLSQESASFLCHVYSRIAQDAGHVFLWSDVSVASMTESLTGEGYLYDTARHLLKNIGDDLDDLAKLIEGYRRAERWAELAVNDYAKQASDEGADARIYLEYSVYRHMSSYVMDWVDDADAELHQDVKLFPTMVELICHEATRRINTLRTQSGLAALL